MLVETELGWKFIYLNGKLYSKQNNIQIACLSPSDRYLDENVSTLNYASRASMISNIPIKNIDPKIMMITE